MADEPLVSIVIANWNGACHLQDCLESISTQSYPSIEVIVVDNASIDGSVEMVKNRFPKVRLIENRTNLGFCASSNQGALASSGELLLLLNNDTTMQRDCVEHLVECIEHQDEKCIGCFPKVVFLFDPHIINAFGASWHVACHWRDARVGQIDLGQFSKSERVFGSIFPAVLLKRNTFIKIGMLDETFFSYCEDFDLCYRANILGYYFVTAPDAVVKHKYRSTAASAYKKRWQHYFFVRNYLAVFIKNYSLGNLIRHLPYALYRYLVKSALVSLRNRDFPGFFLHIRALLFLVAKLPRLLQARRWVQRHRVRADEQVWSYSDVEHRNLFHHFGSPVLSLLNVRAGLAGVRMYKVGDREYQIE